MKTNVGTVDRIARIVLGVALIALALFAPPQIEWKWIGFLGVVPILTAVVGWCPAYTLFGVRT
ncbi:MAG: DUF2892 domain-containing protein [Flavobacteriaceae bacterium]